MFCFCHIYDLSPKIIWQWYTDDNNKVHLVTQIKTLDTGKQMFTSSQYSNLL